MEVIQPLIPKLCEDFRIVVLLNAFGVPPGLTDFLIKQKKYGIVEDFILAPHPNDLLKSHLFMKRHIKWLKDYDFDLWLSSGESQVEERYVLECILPKHCVSVCMWQNITHLFMYHELIVRKLFSEDFPEGMRLQEGPKAPVRKRNSHHYLKRIKQGEFFDLAKGAMLRVYMKIYKKTRVVCDRYILPLLLVGRVFSLGPFDKITQLSSGRSDALIFMDELEAEAHRRLLKTSQVHVSQYPSHGSCRCGSASTKSTTILSPLSGFGGKNRISHEVLSLFYRDFKAVLLGTGAISIHLRLHPDETGVWPQQLRDYLVSRGMDVSVVGCERSIREIMCDYMGIAGFASAALRDARASCDYAFVVGFEAVSNVHFSNPKFVFANSERIDWIDVKGEFADGIFVRKKFASPERQSVPELLLELSRIKKSRGV